MKPTRPQCTKFHNTVAGVEGCAYLRVESYEYWIYITSWCLWRKPFETEEDKEAIGTRRQK